MKKLLALLIFIAIVSSSHAQEKINLIKDVVYTTYKSSSGGSSTGTTTTYYYRIGNGEKTKVKRWGGNLRPYITDAEALKEFNKYSNLMKIRDLGCYSVCLAGLGIAFYEYKVNGVQKLNKNMIIGLSVAAGALIPRGYLKYYGVRNLEKSVATQNRSITSSLNKLKPNNLYFSYNEYYNNLNLSLSWSIK